MQYSIGVEYALHCLVYLIDIPPDSTIGIKELSAFQGVSETYLSKIFSKLTKAGIVSSVPGAKGGYKLAKSPDDISFWDVVEAVEGATPIFQCKNIIENGYLYRDNRDKSYSACSTGSSSCTINLVMLEAEDTMRHFLRGKSLTWLNEELDRVLPPRNRQETRAFFAKDSM
ncbi:RrF2 family transcriptional regulator [Paenibacillus sp. GCM10023248]|uniref:RrF2 family transcriptional regulator n=1 Tax=Bacillales TaxID=1385 RepID=UPI0023782A6A|nr:MULTISPECIES: Rrf2 family transcriptional regulator [Bacillales]MDD9270463.1 Rrf2 family transcriptional regulator [Paenibacillus sp. MAHUQ-63]MDR6884171.1 Rrf2 family protein [Bacillus sp. 3255]